MDVLDTQRRGRSNERPDEGTWPFFVSCVVLHATLQIVQGRWPVPSTGQLMCCVATKLSGYVRDGFMHRITEATRDAFWLLFPVTPFLSFAHVLGELVVAASVLALLAWALYRSASSENLWSVGRYGVLLWLARNEVAALSGLVVDDSANLLQLLMLIALEMLVGIRVSAYFCYCTGVTK